MRLKLTLAVMSALCALSLNAQKKEWSKPYVGYSNNKEMNIESVLFDKKKTVMHVVFTADSGTVMSLSSDTYISADGQRYPIKNAGKLQLDKPFVMPKEGRMKAEILFAPMPTDTRILHFVETSGENGWKLCNVRERKDDLETVIPEDWHGLEYSSQEVLPVSRFSDDSTFVDLKILNYVPEMGKTFSVNFISLDMNHLDEHKFGISADGSSTARLHPCVPVTAYAYVGSSPAMPLVIVPGGHLSVLVDAGDMGKGFAAKAFKGTCSSVNYEINVLGMKDIVSRSTSDSHMDSLLMTGKEVNSCLNGEYLTVGKSILESGCSYATKKWLRIYNMIESIREEGRFEQYISRLVIKDLQAAGSRILKNNSLTDWVSSIRPFYRRKFLRQNLCESESMTLFPNYISYMDVYSPEVKVSDYNMDIYRLFKATVSYERYSESEGDSIAAKIKDDDLRHHYDVVKERWSQYVENIRKKPHVHFDEHSEASGEALLDSLLHDYQGKSVVLIGYNSEDEACEDILERVEKMVADKGNSRVAVACVDIDLPFNGVESWLRSVSHRSIECYGGLKTRYETLFASRHKCPAGGCLYKVYGSDGQCLLSTGDASQFFELLKQM